MCELMGLSSSYKTTINLSLTVLAERGESPHLHGDGWGIAFYEGNDVRLIKDAGPAKNSEWVEFIKSREIHSHDIIAHIRKSTMGKVNYSNTHPFIREVEGRIHSFAHNGTLKDIFHNKAFRPRNFHPVGDTDSELAFCLLMDRMEDLWRKKSGVPSIESRMELLRKFSDDLRGLGPANFLYSDGDAFFAHADKRHDPVKDELIWPGLHYLEIECDKNHHIMSHAPEGGVHVESDDDNVTLFASVPLNDENWVPMEIGELIAVSRGKIIDSRKQEMMAG